MQKRFGSVLEPLLPFNPYCRLKDKGIHLTAHKPQPKQKMSNEPQNTHKLYTFGT